MGEYVYTTHTFPMLDTGIGISLGFKSDDDLREHNKAERANLDPEVQAALKDFDREMQRAFARELLGIPAQQADAASAKRS